MDVLDRLSYCSCGRNTPVVQYERDLKSGTEVCKACAKHDKALEKYGDSVDVLQYRYPEDRTFVYDMLWARPINPKEQLVKELATAYYTGHNLLMSDAPIVSYSMKKRKVEFTTPTKRSVRPRRAVKKPVRAYLYKANPYRAQRRYRSKRRRVVRRRTKYRK